MEIYQNLQTFIHALHIVYREDQEMRSEGKKGLVPFKAPPSLDNLVEAC